jgi:cytochrome c oxidase subunit II
MGRLTGTLFRRGAARAMWLVATVLIGMAALSGTASAEQPKPWELGFQPAATPITQRIHAFHDELLVIIFAITIFVLGLLLYVIVRFNSRRNPVPSRTTHNTLIEVLWTVVPVLILVTIAIPSFKLMYYMDRVPKESMTIKVTAHQWYWSYAYPDNGGFAFDSNMVEASKLKPGEPRILTVDNPLVIPVDTNIRVQVTSTDVIHSFFIPPFGVQEYAIIGRLNEAWMRVLHPGTYYGECNQICGVNHSYMPIEVRAVSKADFEKWVVDAKKKFAADAPAPGPQPKPAPDAVPKLADADATTVAGN